MEVLRPVGVPKGKDRRPVRYSSFRKDDGSQVHCSTLLNFNLIPSATRPSCLSAFPLLPKINLNQIQYMHSPTEYTQAFVDFRAAFSQVWTSHDELDMEEGSHRIFGEGMGPHSFLNRHQNGLRTLDINTGAPVRLGMMSVIFCVSLLGASCFHTCLIQFVDHGIFP